MKHEITYIGGIAELNSDDRDVQRRVDRYLNTADLLEVDEYLIDVKNIFERKFMCCIENCDFYVRYNEDKKLFNNKNKSIKYVDKSCCYGGSLEIPQTLIDNIDKHIDSICEFCDEECKEHIKKKGWKHKINKNLTGVGTLPKDNRCLFTFVENGMPYCALHRYALETNNNILDFKPFECFLYPLEIMEIDGKILLTSVDNRGSNQGFIRWGDVHCPQGCQFKTKYGLPMYEYAKDVIELTLGKGVYLMLDKIYKEKYNVKE